MAWDSPDPNWRKLGKKLDELVVKYGGSFYDTGLHRSWDPGQALCRALYGPNWEKHPDKVRADEADAQCPAIALQTCQEWIDKGLPHWLLSEKEQERG